MIALLVFLVSLPLTIYTLAGCLQLIDQRESAVTVVGKQVAVDCFSFADGECIVRSERILIGVGTAFCLAAGFQFGVRYLIRSGRWPAGRIE